MENKKGFTIIELIVVIAIVAILASVVTSSVVTYISKAKIARANFEVKEIEKALLIFNSEFGDISSVSYMAPVHYSEWGGMTEDNGYLDTSDGRHYFSEIYSNWDGFNADFLSENAYYYITFQEKVENCWIDPILHLSYCDKTGIFCPIVHIASDEPYGYFGKKYLFCDICDCSRDLAFKTTSY